MRATSQHVPAAATRWASAYAKRGELIGWVELRRQHSDARSADLTVALHPGYRGHGYAREAAARLIDWAFDQLPLTRVVGTELPPHFAIRSDGLPRVTPLLDSATVVRRCFRRQPC